MAAKVKLTITEGPAAGRKFEFSSHDSFVFGRMPECHVKFPDDHAVSRHHFILEACPPKASLRDLGSLNGTFVNSVKWGGRDDDETPEQAARRIYPIVDLVDGDEIKVGKTRIAVAVEDDPSEERVSAGIEPGALSELSPEELFAFVFGDAKTAGLLQIPGYRIEKEIGRGGFGAVYRARRVSDGAAVAIKVMLSHAAASQNAILQFKREMEVHSQLNHPNIVPYLERGSHEGAFFFVMKLCDGGSLFDLMNRNGGPLSVTQLMPHALEALEGLAHAHAKGFVHRDIKPGNILIHQGKAMIADFGLAKSFHLTGLSGPRSLTGDTAGTPVFMPPEQIMNFKQVKPTSDVFSVGATIYFALTGAFPFDFPPKRDPMDVVLNDAVVPIRKRLAGIPEPLATKIDRSVTKSAGSRFKDAGEFLDAIRREIRS